MRKHTAKIDTPGDANAPMGPSISVPVLGLAIAAGGWRSLRPRGA